MQELAELSSLGLSICGADTALYITFSSLLGSRKSPGAAFQPQHHPDAVVF